MAFVSPRMSLKVWNAGSDPYDHEQLADNFLKLDQHDHSMGRGTPIGGAGIQDGAITTAHVYPGAIGSDALADGSIGTAKLAAGAVTTPKLADGGVTAAKLNGDITAQVGINDGTVVRRAHISIPTTETRTNVAYGLLTTNDSIANLVLPSFGLIRVWYKATWQESVTATARAAIFIGSNQLKVAIDTAGAPVTQAASLGLTGAVVNTDTPLYSSRVGLTSFDFGSAYTGDVTTGQLWALAAYTGNYKSETGGTVRTSSAQGGGGPMEMFAAAGTYTISVQFKSSSGTVTVKNRLLLVEVVSFG